MIWQQEIQFVKKLGLRLTGCRKCLFFNFDFFHFFIFQIAIFKNLIELPSFFKMGLEGSFEVLLRHKYF